MAFEGSNIDFLITSEGFQFTPKGGFVLQT